MIKYILIMLIFFMVTLSSAHNPEFIFTQYNNTLFLSVNSTDGFIHLPLIYGNGTQFIDYGNEERPLIISQNKTLKYYFDTGSIFVVSNYVKICDQPENCWYENEESHFLEATRKGNKVEVQNIITKENCIPLGAGQSCTIGNTLLKLESLGNDKNKKFATFSIEERRANFNSIFDNKGNFLNLPNILDMKNAYAYLQISIESQDDPGIIELYWDMNKLIVTEYI